jgi:HD-GYP domain-containing protein (c-di-GMP phosphodiesterase class II)
MIANPQVPLHRLVLSLSEALDHVHPQIQEHQQRVAYIATNVARRMGFKDRDLLNIFIAAALHDLGLIGIENRVKVIHFRQLEEARSHAEIGYCLLKENPLFAPAAKIVRYHHASWDDSAGKAAGGQSVPLASHILVLADTVETKIDRAVPILEQKKALSEEIASMSGGKLCPACVDAFLDVACAEAFWLDVVCQRIYGALLKQVDWPLLTLDEEAIGPVAEMFGRVVDAASQWTMVHTAGVTAVSVALAQRLNFSPREQYLMRAAGYLHDLGKLTVPTRVLDKPGKLNEQDWALMKGHTYHTFRILDTIGGMPQISEWAAFHHERLDGKGYPFHHRGENLTLGSRIMAVADVFVAITEDRPYRKGMSSEEALVVLNKLTNSGGLDGDIVTILKRDFDTINNLRMQEQAEYARKQDRLLHVVGMTGVPAACSA